MTNWINDIEIKNFKSLRHQKIEGCRRVNLFVGYPNVGKSNVLEALSGFCFLNKKTFPGQSLKQLIRYSSFNDLFFNREVAQPIGIVLNDSEVLTYRLDDLERLHMFISGYKPKHELDSGVSVRRGVIYDDAVFQPDGSMVYNSFEELESTGKAMVKRYAYKPGASYRAGRALSLEVPHGENLPDMIEIFPELAKECNQMLQEYGLNLDLDKREGKSVLQLRKTLGSGTTMVLGWELMADTLQRLFFYQAAIQSNQNSILLFEEPEAHMFPPYISKFTADIMYDKKENQYFIATHSPFVLNDFMEELEPDQLSVYAVGFKDGETTIHKLTDKQINDVYQYGVDLFFNLEEFLKDGVA